MVTQIPINHHIEILLKVELSTITLTLIIILFSLFFSSHDLYLWLKRNWSYFVCLDNHECYSIFVCVHVHPSELQLKYWLCYFDLKLNLFKKKHYCLTVRYYIKCVYNYKTLFFPLLCDTSWSCSDKRKENYMVTMTTYLKLPSF